MQQYIRSRCNEIDMNYGQKEYAARGNKDGDVRKILDDKARQINANKTKRKVMLIIAEIIAVLVGVICTSAIQASSGGLGGLLVLIGLCTVAYNVVNIMFRNLDKQIEQEVQSRINSRENSLQSEIQKINNEKSAAKKLLEAEINNQMNQYRKTFEQSKVCMYLVEWLINVLSIEINKADRSKWLPQVKATLRFNVEYGFIEVPGFGKYDMANQGIQIDNNPMALGALAYVLEKKSIAEAQKRFQVDPNGGRPIFTSSRADTHVQIMYSAPNGGANTAR